jgi:hypothetical protein
MNSRFRTPFWLIQGRSADVVQRVSQLLGNFDDTLEEDVPTEDGLRSGMRVEDVEMVLTVLRSTIKAEVNIYRCFPWMGKAKRWQKHPTRLRRRARYSKRPTGRPKAAAV